MRKVFAGIGISCMGIVLLLVGAYFSLAYYYSQGFTCGVWINGVYCTGFNVSDVNQMLADKNDYKSIEVIDKEGNTFVIQTDEIDFRLEYTDKLEEIKKKQEPVKWLQYYLEPCYYEISPQILFSEEKVCELLKNADFMRNGVYDVKNTAVVKWTSDGYVLLDDTEELLIKWKAEDAVIDSISKREGKVRLYEAGCYGDLIKTDEMHQVYALWDKISAFQDFKVTYQMGNELLALDEGDVAKWILRDTTGNIVFDENGDLILDESKVYEYTKSLSDKYDTVGQPRLFKTTDGREVLIEVSKYGNDLDEKKEAEKLIEAFYNDDSGRLREPVYKLKAKNQGSDDIGGTYVEVDMTAQRLYYYRDYELKIESGVVTGNMRLNHDTPAMIAPIYYMQRNRILRGDNYASFVYYWMAFYRGYGLHDATWRRESEFGTDTYLRNGSHGCVNLPKSVAAELYEYLEIGVPVITYY